MSDLDPRVLLPETSPPLRSSVSAMSTLCLLDPVARTNEPPLPAEGQVSINPSRFLFVSLFLSRLSCAFFSCSSLHLRLAELSPRARYAKQPQVRVD